MAAWHRGSLGTSDSAVPGSIPASNYKTTAKSNPAPTDLPRPPFFVITLQFLFDEIFAERSHSGLYFGGLPSMRGRDTHSKHTIHPP